MNIQFIKNILIKIYYSIFKRRIVTHTYAGKNLSIYLANPASESWYNTDWKRLEINYLTNQLNLRGSTVFNIGAHEGIVALIFSKIVTGFGKVIAVEMDTNHTKVAKINCELNDAKNLYIINAAISNVSGNLEYSNDQVIKSSHSFFKSSIRCITIDELTKLYGVPDLIYMDVEGYEYNALLAATNTLKMNPAFCIEVHSNHGLENYNGSVRGIIRLFPKRKYTLYMSKAVHECKVIKFNIKSELVQDRFYLIAIPNILKS